MMKRILLGVLITGWFCSCNNSSGHSETTESDSMHHMAMDSGSLAMQHMDSLMHSMNAVTATGDLDADFANFMIAHHQGAVDMSREEMRSGRDSQMKEMAGKIIVDQQAEIIAMREFLNTYTPTNLKQGQGELQASMKEMETAMNELKSTNNPDRDYAQLMIIHHQAAIDMCETELAKGLNDKLKRMAKDMKEKQEDEVDEFKKWLK